MNVFDLILFVLSILSLILGFMRGFTQEALGITGWLGAGFGTVYGFSFLRPLGREVIKNPLVADSVTGLVLFLCLLIFFTLICRTMANRIKKSALGSLDRSLGLVFGLGRAFFLFSLVYLIAVSLTQIQNWPQSVVQARSLPILKQGAHLIRLLLPTHMKPSLKQSWHEDTRTPEDIMKGLVHLKPAYPPQKKK